MPLCDSEAITISSFVLKWSQKYNFIVDVCQMAENNPLQKKWKKKNPICLLSYSIISMYKAWHIHT